MHWSPAYWRTWWFYISCLRFCCDMWSKIICKPAMRTKIENKHKNKKITPWSQPTKKCKNSKNPQLKIWFFRTCLYKLKFATVIWASSIQEAVNPKTWNRFKFPVDLGKGTSKFMWSCMSVSVLLLIIIFTLSMPIWYADYI